MVNVLLLEFTNGTLDVWRGSKGPDEPRSVSPEMETATIEQIHRLHHIPLKTVDRLPAIRRFSNEAGLSKSCAVKEFRFPPPLAKRKEKKKKKLPPIPEHMLPKRHNSLEESDAGDDLLPLPAISTEATSLEQDNRSFSVDALPKTPTILFNVREFTFPESTASKSAKRKKSSQQLPPADHVLQAFTPRFKDTTIQARIEKLAKLKRKEKARRSLDRRYERKLQSMQDFSVPAKPKMNAFKAKREREINTVFHLRDNKQLPFKQMTRPPDDSDKPKINPRLYTRIVDNIYSYSRGILGDQTEQGRHKPRSERLMVSPATGRDDMKSTHTQTHKPPSFLPPIHL